MNIYSNLANNINKENKESYRHKNGEINRWIYKYKHSKSNKINKINKISKDKKNNKNKNNTNNKNKINKKKHSN